MSVELVILVPALVLLTLFVLWAGRGGRAGLSADLAAEEAATAAALCCEEGEAFESDRDALVADMLAARPGLQFLCIGGLQPAADPDSGAEAEFVQEDWLDFDPDSGAHSGGVGVLGVRFTCETDGAVAPLRGLFPTVTFHGQASEVVVRRAPPPDIGFKFARFIATEGTGNQLVFKVTSREPVPQEVEVEYEIVAASTTASESGSGLGDIDYTPALGSQPIKTTMMQGNDELDIAVTLSDDSVYEGTEKLVLKILNLYSPPGSSTPLPLGSTIAQLDSNRLEAEGWIEDDEAVPYLFIRTPSPCQVGEGDPLTFDVRLRDQANANDAPSAVTVTVDADTASTGTGAGHATAGTDYTALTGNVVTFNPGDVTKPVTVTILDDPLSPVGEPDETFKVELRNASNAPLGSTTEATCTILDDEVRVTAAAVSADEGDPLTFGLTLDRRPAADIKVGYDLVDHAAAVTLGTDAEKGAACGGTVDYELLSGDITISPSQYSPNQPITLTTVTSCDDDRVESDETFWLELSILSGEAVAASPGGAVGRIVNDDIPVISISPSPASGTEGGTPVNVTATLDDGSGNALELAQDITVAYTVGGTGTNPATDPGTLPGTVCASTDADYGVDVKGNTAPTGTLTFTAGAPAVVQQEVFDVDLLDDYCKEPTETLRIDLSIQSDPFGQRHPSAASVFEDRDGDPLTDDSYADVEILDRPPPELSVSDFRGDEGTAKDFTVTLANSRAETVTVDYNVCGRTGSGTPGTTDCTTIAPSNTLATVPGVAHHDFIMAGTCTAPTGARSGMLTFSGGTTTDTVGVELCFDAFYEVDETLRLELSSPSRAVLADRDTSTAGVQPYGEGTIVDKDAPKLYVDDDTANEGETLNFTVTLCNPISGKDVTVDYATQTRSAIAGRDFTATSGSLDFPDTMASQKVTAPCVKAAPQVDAKQLTVDVTTLNDLIAEIDEEVHLVLSNQTSHVALGNAIGVGTITNVNPATVRVSNPSATEGDPLGFVISLEDDSGNPATITKDVTVNYATYDGTATAGSDYTSVSSSVTFDHQSTVRTHTVSVATSADNLDENDETVELVLTLAPNTDNAGLGDSVGTGTIVDTPPPYVRIDSPAAVSEGDDVTFTVSLHDRSGALTSAATLSEVSWATADRTATAGSDYTSGSGSLIFDPGDQQKTITVTTLTDSTAEPAETFRVDLSGPRNVIIDRAVGIGTIEADLEPKLSVSDASASPGDNLVFTVTLDAPSSSDVTVDYDTVDGTALDGTDYTAVSGTLTIAPGSTAATVPVTTDSSSTGNKSLTLELSNPANAKIDDGTGVGTILAGPVLSIADASAAESDGRMIFDLSLSSAYTGNVSMDWSSRQWTGPGAATGGVRCSTQGVDYQTAHGSYTMVAPVTSAQLDFIVCDDQVDEYLEMFRVELFNASGATLGDKWAVGTIEGDLACVDMRTSSTDTLPTASISGTSADEDDGTIDMTITVTQAMCQDYEFRFTVSDDARSGRNSATVGTDYLQPANVTLVRGQTSVAFSVTLIDDDLVEADETFSMRVWSRMPGRRALATVTVYPTIVDDDEATLQLSDTSTTEGGYLSFVVALDKPSYQAVTFDYATSDGSAPAATAGADYVATSGSATIAAGVLSVTVAVRTLEDLVYEYDENVALTVSNLSGAQPDPDGAVAVGLIYDNEDRAPAASVSDSSADEGEKLQFTVTLDEPSGRALTADWATRDGTAAAGSDYTAASGGTVTFAAGDTSKTVDVTTLTDRVAESTEQMFVDISNSSGEDGPRLGDSIGVGQIRDTTDRSVSVSDAFVTEGGTLAFEVGFPGLAGSRDITLKYQTRAGTATAGDDYDNAVESVPQELKIVAGDTSVDVLLPTVQDRLDEDGETFELVLSDPEGAVIADGTASGLIIDDDPLPRLRVGDTSASEGDGASVTFTVSLSEPSGRDVTVDYTTLDGDGDGDDDNDAKADDDYNAASSTLTIDAGQQQATVTVNLVNDDDAENVERFRLQLSGAVNASLDDSVGFATITDDDGSIQILVDNPDDVYEGAGASVTFRVRLSRAATEQVTVDYATEDATAKAGSDYTRAWGTLTFAAGQTVKTVTVPLVNDDVEENSETFRLKLSSPSGDARLGNDRATVLILDDDGLPTLSVADAAAQTEGSTATFTVTLSRSSARDATVAYATRADPTAGDAAATSGADYTAASGTLTIAARSTTATATVTTLDDSFDEHTETFWLRLSSPTGAAILDGTAVGTINDDDPLPRLSIADASADEASKLSFDVSMDVASGRSVSVPWSTDALSPGPRSALPGQDYTAASGTVRFASGTTTASVEVTSLADDISEQDERFTVQLGTPVNAVLDDAAAVGTIIDDDSEPRLSIADVSVDEDDGPAVFPVTLSRASSQAVTVSYSTADGTATDPDDYAPAAVRTLTISAGLTKGEISVAIVDDNLAEGSEDFTVTLSNPVNAVIADGAGTATGTILDDEGQPRLTISNATECEDGSAVADCQVRSCRASIQRSLNFMRDYSREIGRKCQELLAAPGACQAGQCAGNGQIDFPVQLSHAGTEDTSVRYTTFAGSAKAGSDYTAVTGTLTIPAGDTSASVPVVLVNTGNHEQQSETFRLRLDNPIGVELEIEEAVGTILDDDMPPTVSSGPFDAYSNENDGYAYHHVKLTHPSDLTVTVGYHFGYVNYLPAQHDNAYQNGGYLDCTKFPNGPGLYFTCTELHTYCQQNNCQNHIQWGSHNTRTLTFAPGVVEQTIAVPLIDNDLTTGTNVRYDITLRNSVNAIWGRTSALGIVWDDESAPYVDSVGVKDVLEGDREAVFNVTLNRIPNTGQTATFSYSTSADTATAGSDFMTTTGSVPFSGTNVATVSVPIFDDSTVESDETFSLSVGGKSATVTIIDDDTLPEISVADSRVNEDADTMPFQVSLSRFSASDITVYYETVDGTATAGSDYTAVAKTLLPIPAGATGASLSVTIIDDTDDTEGNETFTLRLSGATGATISNADATGTIIEDANLPAITIADRSISENIAITGRFMRFLARLDKEAPDDVDVDWQVLEVPSLGDRAATIGTDFRPCITPCSTYPTSGTIRISKGSTYGRSIQAEIIADALVERDEQFQVVLSNPRGATLEDSIAWGTILNDDLPIVTVADVSALESADAVVFTVQLHAAGLDPASLDYKTVVRASQGDKAASPGDDYTTASGTLNFAAGTTTATISVPIIGDTDDEYDETFLLQFSKPKNLRFNDATAVGTITDDDDGYWIDDRSVWENAGPMVFTIERDHTSTDAVTVNYRFGSGGSATGGAACSTDGVDFEWPSGSSTGSVTMPAADKSVTLTVTLCDDSDTEGRENVEIVLTNQTGRKTTGVGTIVDDDEDNPLRPAAPSGLAAAGGDGSVTLSWSNPADSTITRYEYNVNHNDTGTGNFTGWSAWTPVPGSGATTTSYTITGLTNGKVYRYHLRAVNAGGAGAAAPNAAPWYVTATPTAP